MQAQGTPSNKLQLIKNLTGNETIFVDDLAGGKSGRTTARYLREYALKPIEIVFGFGDVQSRAIAKMRSRQWIESIVVSVHEPFNADATLSLGFLNQPEALIGTSKVDLLMTGDFQFSVNRQFANNTDLYAYLNAQGSVTGNGSIFFYLR